MNKQWIFLLGLICGSFAGNTDAQTLVVYPGDVTNNGVVNNLDFLHLGLAYNFAGPARDSGALIFAPVLATPWNYQFPNGLNMAYADCNGDGVVNYYFDAFPLYSNYGQQRTNNVIPDVFTPGLNGIDPPLQFDASGLPDLVQGGQAIQLPIELGTADLPAEDVYGIAFSMLVEPNVVDVNSIMFNLSETSWANPDNDRIWVYKKVGNNRVDVAWVRTDRNQKRGFGRIGYVDFVIVVDVIPLMQASPVYIQDIKMMDKFGNYSTVAGDTLLLNLDPDSNATSVNAPVKNILANVYPNPVTDQLFVHASEKITGLALHDLLGQVVWSQAEPNANPTSVLLPELPSGMYTLRIETEYGAVFRKVQIHH
ncbi:MAG: T9SS type A sorting domain-containing protein [Saprospiraceae bacterium]|nr:T9SS type A sorting domain-containing protein [Saprospiraceae bacterium]